MNLAAILAHLRQRIGLNPETLGLCPLSLKDCRPRLGARLPHEPEHVLNVRLSRWRLSVGLIEDNWEGIGAEGSAHARFGGFTGDGDGAVPETAPEDFVVNPCFAYT